jgi:hypothetical protein
MGFPFYDLFYEVAQGLPDDLAAVALAECLELFGFDVPLHRLRRASQYSSSFLVGCK